MGWEIDLELETQGIVNFFLESLDNITIFTCEDTGSGSIQTQEFHSMCRKMKALQHEDGN